ncbi:hypothetical protein L1887_57812 [Cichorium endivia]|nr:hypothetical protein L1887_57812 [Cichorium endivia]
MTASCVEKKRWPPGGVERLESRNGAWGGGGSGTSTSPQISVERDARQTFLSMPPPSWARLGGRPVSAADTDTDSEALISCEHRQRAPIDTQARGSRLEDELEGAAGELTFAGAHACLGLSRLHGSCASMRDAGGRKFSRARSTGHGSQARSLSVYVQQSRDGEKERERERESSAGGKARARAQRLSAFPSFQVSVVPRPREKESPTAPPSIPRLCELFLLAAAAPMLSCLATWLLGCSGCPPILRGRRRCQRRSDAALRRLAQPRIRR